MNAIVPASRPKSVLVDMADRYGMEPQAFELTVRATCMPPDSKTGRVPTREEFAAFLLVAKEYRLNPITREIFAFMAKHGGIVPVVSVDGWLNLVNSHKECDGFSFEIEHDDNGKIISCTCRMYRKDRSHPVEVTEYFTECVRPTDPWRNMPHRMIRHKAMIQAARYAFGFSGIYDEDEGRTIAEAVDVTPAARPRIPSPDEAEQQPQGREEHPDHGTDKYRPGDTISVTSDSPVGATAAIKVSDPISTGRQLVLPDVQKDYEGFVSLGIMKIAEHTDGGALETFWNAEIAPFEREVMPPDWEDLVDAYGKQQTRMGGDE